MEKELPKSVPDQIHSFQLDLVGGVTGKRFLGDFTCKIPRIKEQCLIDKHEAMLNGVYVESLNLGVRKAHKMLAYLRFTVTEFPKFWKDSDLGYELLDLNVIEKIYDEVIEFEKRWMISIWGEEQLENGNE